MLLSIDNLFVEARCDFDEVGVLRKLLTFKNPRYNPRYADNGVVRPEYVFLDDENRFPRGLLPYVAEQLGYKQIEPEYDYRVDISLASEIAKCPPDILGDKFTLRDYQTLAVEQAYHYKRGIVQMATGSGKTLVAAALAKMIELHHDGSTVTFVNKLHLLEQTAKRYREYGLEDVGMIGSGCIEPARHTVAMVQTASSLLRRGDLPFTDGVTGIIWDETHHLGADTWGALAYSIPTTFSIGMSGTPFRTGVSNMEDPADVQLQAMTGNVLVRISASYLIKRGLLAKPYIFMIPIDQTSRPLKKTEAKVWHSVEKVCITENEHRNDIITRLAKECVSRNLNLLVLVSKISHGQDLLRRMTEVGLKPIFLSGGPKRHFYDIAAKDSVMSEATDAEVDVQDFLDGKWNVLIGSTVFDEGVDLPEVNAVINCAGGKSFIRNLQRVGRGLRPKKDTNEAYIFDFEDDTHDWVKKHSDERVADYRTEPEYVVKRGYSETVKFFGEPW